MKKVSSRKHDRFGRVLDSDPVYLIAALVLMALLVSFYAVLLVNMNAIDTKTEDLKEHPYAVTVAAGRSETLLMQVRTLDDRLAFARTPETIASVKSEFASIDQDLRQAIEVIEQRHRGNPDKAHELASSYKEFCTQQEQLIAISLSDASDETVAEFLATAVNPRIDEMLDLNTEIIDAASQSFDRLYTTVNDTRQDAIFTATVLMAAVMVSLVLFFVVIRRKNRQQEELQESLRRAVQSAQEASEAKSRFLSNVSHDIRTPLTAIMGLTDIALEHADERDRVMESLEKVQLSSHHLLNLVNDVLDMSKLEAGQMVMEQEPFDIEVLMHGVSSLVEAQIEKGGLTHRRHRENIQHTALVGSSLKLRQIMVNLFSNAIKYNKPGGAIDTYARELSCDGTTVWYEFRITDTGIGMSRDFVENQLFKPFTQESADARTQYRGTGLGMSIVKELVSQMGGSISAESQPGEGTAFTFRLPFLLDKNAAAKPQPKPTDNGRLDGMHILLVEDNDINMEVAEFQLTSQGAAVDKAWNGREAVERFAASAPGGYQAILMDVMMPVMDGFEASRAIRALDRPDAATVPILAMTAQASDECAQSCHRVGMNGRLVKPLDAKKLAKSIREAVQNKQ